MFSFHRLRLLLMSAERMYITVLYRELNIVGVYLSPACGGGKITSTQYFLVIKVFLGGVSAG